MIKNKLIEEYIKYWIINLLQRYTVAEQQKGPWV